MQNLQTFGWKMNAGASCEVKQAHTKVQFGDGYAQRVSFGINNKSEIWSGAKTGDYATVIRPIAEFLDAHKGITPFYWTTPLGKRLKFVCADYSVSQRKGNFWQISLKFEQVF